ncbi:hypothetical protein BST97_03645 [Nonlabens spongiae]|uniref:Prenyltransferase n=1 Tax=Nonlabens spongiae TaxID=331648 RepID=A0A1W6MHS8_9FLAO|nr:hypothetical protein BST97_03645 [Nonlabens spongiae]
MHVAVALVCLAVLMNSNVTGNLDYGVPLILFCLTLVGYNVTKYAHLWLARKTFPFKILTTIVTIVCCLLSAILIIPVLNTELIVLLGLIALIGFSYTFPICKGKSLRHFPVVKLISVSVIWVLLIVVLPWIFELLVAQHISGWHVIVESRNAYAILILRGVQVLIYVFALCIPFEIRDLKYDEEDLQTLPQLIGVGKSKLLGVFLCVITLIIEILLFQYFEIGSILNMVFFLLTAVMIWFSSRERSDYYASFWVEGIPILWFINLLLFA